MKYWVLSLLTIGIVVIIGLRFGNFEVKGQETTQTASQPTIIKVEKAKTPKRTNSYLYLINQNRKEPLTEDVRLDQSAKEKCADMQKKGYWAHGNWTKFIWRHTDSYTIGENLARNYLTKEQTVQAWMNSPEHRENIENLAYKRTGFATCSGIVGSVVVEHFSN